jgi:NADH:ubiquinone oxidoreductase subunit C
MTENTEIVKGEIQTLLGSQGIKAKALGKNSAGSEMIELEAGDLVQACKSLKSKGFKFMNYMTATEIKRGLQSTIQLDNMAEKKCIVIKTLTPKEKPFLPSLTELFPAANWTEREAYDMIGISFEGHPNMTRILNPDDWEGHPLRKDYTGPLDELNQPIKYTSCETI